MSQPIQQPHKKKLSGNLYSTVGGEADPHHMMEIKEQSFHEFVISNRSDQRLLRQVLLELTAQQFSSLKENSISAFFPVILQLLLSQDPGSETITAIIFLYEALKAVCRHFMLLD